MYNEWVFSSSGGGSRVVDIENGPLEVDNNGHVPSSGGNRVAGLHFEEGGNEYFADIILGIHNNFPGGGVFCWPN